FISALAFVLLVRDERRHLKPLCAAIGLAVLIYLPNLWWNWSNGFVSYLHLRDNAHLTHGLLHPLAFAAFLGSQFVVFGPLFFAGLFALGARPGPLLDRRAFLRAIFRVPTLGTLRALSLLSGAEPNGAAPAYVSAIVLVIAWGLRSGRRRWLL